MLKRHIFVFQKHAKNIILF